MQQQRERPTKPRRPRLSLAARLVAGILTLLGALGLYPSMVFLIQVVRFGSDLRDYLPQPVSMVLAMLGLFSGGIAALLRLCLLARWLWSLSALCCLVYAVAYYYWLHLLFPYDKELWLWFEGFIGCAAVLGVVARWIGNNAEE